MTSCSPRTSFGRAIIVAALAFLVLFTSRTAQAQPVFDGLTVGGGISMYRGNLDHNPDDNLIKYLASSTIHGMLAADRQFGWFVGETGLTYDRLRLLHTVVDARIHLVSADFTIGLPLPTPEGLGVRLFAGVAPSLQLGAYRYVNRAWAERTDYEQIRSRFVLTFPMGIVFQDAVRVGMRFAASDDFDGAVGGGVTDVVAFVSVTHRFNLTR
jgi:hypothetical protein